MRNTCLPIPDIGLSENKLNFQIIGAQIKGHYSIIFSDVAALGLGRRALFIDLDMMIMGSIDRFFDPTEPKNVGCEKRGIEVILFKINRNIFIHFKVSNFIFWTA